MIANFIIRTFQCNQNLRIDIYLRLSFIKLDCSSAWVEGKVIETVKLLRSNFFPSPSFKCEYCNYLKKRWQLSQN